jgi:gas vesicle protein
LKELKEEVSNFHNDLNINIQQLQQNITKGPKQIENEIKEGNEKTDHNTRQLNSTLNIVMDNIYNSVKYYKDIIDIVIEARNTHESI